MSDTERLIQEIYRLPREGVSEVLDFVGYLKHKRARAMERAAEEAAAEYAADPELTAFGALDGEDFYEYESE
jgi:hypothetical protein